MKYKEESPRVIHKNPHKLDKYIGWLASIKIDGWQGVWDGSGKMYTRSYGKQFQIPKWWLKLLQKADIPAMVGEIKIVGSYTSQASLTSIRKGDWGTISNPKVFFHVFDIIEPRIRKLPFRIRVEKMNQFVKLACSNVRKCPIVATKQILIQNRPQLIKLYQKVINDEGEGLVLSDPSSPYDSVSSRSSHRIKLKGRNDDEGIVVGYTLRNDRKTLKSIKLRYKNIVFNIGIGLTNAERRNYKPLFPIGTILTFSYRTLGASGKPQEARKVAVRDRTTLTSSHWILN